MNYYKGMNNMITLKNICKIYGKKENQFFALKNINLTIEKGELIAITGPSGSGKSTLLNILGCLTEQSDGDYYIDNNLVSNMSIKEKALLRNKKFGFIVQDFALINKYTVLQNVLLPVKYKKGNKSRSKETAENLLKTLGINSKAKEYPTNLSGGQKQRVAIARALINNPDIILADEPTGALDQKTGTDVLSILKDINKQGKTVIIVTHDPKIADSCDRTINIVDGMIH